jgi:hypothetical protein
MESSGTCLFEESALDVPRRSNIPEKEHKRLACQSKQNISFHPGSGMVSSTLERPGRSKVRFNERDQTQF